MSAWIIALWLGQLAILIYFLWNLTWSDYWFFRGLYRPGIHLLAYLASGRLPAWVYSPIDRGGVLLCFTVATLLYSIIATFTSWLVWRLFRP